MRTTLTFDDDVAAEIERLRHERDTGLKELVNEALRRGLRDMQRPEKRRTPFRTRTFDGGEPLIRNLDNVAEVIALIEGEDFK